MELASHVNVHVRPSPSPDRSASIRGVSRRGFTLVEMVVALAIIVVLIAIGWGSMRSHLPRFRMVQASRGLQGDLVTLKNLAISTNRETRLVFQSAGGDCESDPDLEGGSWTLEVGDKSNRSDSWDLLPVDDDGTDADQSEGRVDLGDSGNRDGMGVCLDEWDTLDGPHSGNEDAIVFSPRGWVSNPGTDFSSTGWIEADLVNQDGTLRGIDDRVTIRVSRSGMVRLVSSLGDEDTSVAGTNASSSAP